MNMISTGIILFIITTIYISAGNASNVFVDVQCKTDNMGQFSHQSLLECVIKTKQEAADAEILIVIWNKIGVKNPLLVFNEGETKLQPRYRFAEPNWNNRSMNVSLLITSTSVMDIGYYKCTVMTNSGHSERDTNLIVTAKYSVPAIRSTSEKINRNEDGSLICDSDGGYPEGQIRWFAEDNTELKEKSKMTVTATQSGLFNLSSKLTLLPGSVSSKYTCVVFSASGVKETEATFEVDIPKAEVDPGQEKQRGLDSVSKVVAPLVVIGSLIIGLLLLLIYKKQTCQAWRDSTTARHHQVVLQHDPELRKEGDPEEVDEECKHRLV